MSPWTILAVLAVLASAFGAGWGGAIKYRNGVDAQIALEQSEANREAERIAARGRTKQIDSFAQKLQAEQGVAAAAARDAERVRHETDRLASRARANASEPEAATVASLAELLREGAGLLEEGRRYLGECGAAREALTESEGRMDR